MIELYLKSRKNEFEAKALYNELTKETIILKGSRISPTVSGGAFRSAKSVEKKRQDASIKEGLLTQDMAFKSASAAANFVTGISTNGLIAWRTAEGVNLRDLLKHSK